MLESGLVLCVQGPGHGEYFSRDDVDADEIGDEDGVLAMGQRFVGSEFFSSIPYFRGRIDGESEDLNIYIVLGD